MHRLSRFSQLNPGESLMTTIIGTEDAETIDQSGQSGPFFVLADDGADTVIGSTEDDTLTGGLGDDSLDGGGGTDLAIVAGTAVIAHDGSAWTVTSDDGTDTLSGIARVEDGNGDVTWLVAEGDSIQDAIDAAAAGDTIVIAAGSYTESLSITKGLTLRAEGEVTIAPTGTTVIEITGDLAGADVTLIGLTLAGVAAAPNQGMGVRVTEHADVGTLTLDDMEIRDAGAFGIFVQGEATQSAAAEVIITGSVFSHNGYNGANGSAHIKLYGFSGDALIQNVTITGAPDPTAEASRPDYGIEFHGTPNPATSPPAMGTVTIESVTIDDLFHKRAFGINNYTDISGLTITDLDLSGTTTSWGAVLSIDGIIGSYDASAWDVALPAAIIATELQGDVVAEPVSPQTITGTDAHDRMMGKGGGDSILGGDGDDELYGHDKPGGAYVSDTGNDTLVGGNGGDSLYGGDGDDLLAGGNGADLIDGGNGFDTADYSGSAVSVSVNLGTGIVSGGEAEGDTLISIEAFIGSAQGDQIQGSGDDDTVAGGEGDDTLIGGEGGDTMLGGNGGDIATGDEGADALYGMDGDDILEGGLGDDLVEGGAGADTLDGGVGANVLSYVTSPQGVTVNLVTNVNLGGDAEGDQVFNFSRVLGSTHGDSVTGLAANSTEIVAGGGNDTVTGGSGIDALYGGEGDDVIAAGGGGDHVEGGNGDDSIDGGNGGDQLHGGAGDDTVLGGADAAADLILGGAGNDSLGGQDGDDVLFGEADADTAAGGNGSDWVQGDDGDDSLSGGAGTFDWVDGGNGNDTIEGSAGSDYLIGGAGDDRFVVDSGSDADAVADFTEGDVIAIRAEVNGTGLESFDDLVAEDRILDATGGVMIDLSPVPGAQLHYIQLAGIDPEALTATNVVFFS